MSTSTTRLTSHRRGRQEARRELEGPQREAEGAVRRQGRGRQAALRGGEGRLHCRTLTPSPTITLSNQTNRPHRAATTTTKSKRVPTSTAHLPPMASSHIGTPASPACLGFPFALSFFMLARGCFFQNNGSESHGRCFFRRLNLFLVWGTTNFFFPSEAQSMRLPGARNDMIPKQIGFS